ncbi:unnamed protein product [Dovyalis caffra]|uniref:Uncharacterized protein n=1 Tax=Dovyalis caffra TaxID=77055 RepID=A0AAV1RWT7_9ROSI|nr:unnamed protein product [Dovyalis caffra]
MVSVLAATPPPRVRELLPPRLQADLPVSITNTGKFEQQRSNTDFAARNPSISDLRSTPSPQWPLGRILWMLSTLLEATPLCSNHKTKGMTKAKEYGFQVSKTGTGHGSRTVNLKEQSGVNHVEAAGYARALQASDISPPERLQPPTIRLTKLKDTDTVEASHLEFRNRDQPISLGGQIGETLKEAVEWSNVMHDMISYPKIRILLDKKEITRPHGVHDTVANISQRTKDCGDSHLHSVTILYGVVDTPTLINGTRAVGDLVSSATFKGRQVGVERMIQVDNNYGSMGNHENEGSHISEINTGKEASYCFILDGLEDEILDRDIQRIDVEQEDRVQGRMVEVVGGLKSIV